MGFSDEMLRFNGIGECITWAMNGITGQAAEADIAKYYEIVRWGGERRLSLLQCRSRRRNTHE